MRERMISELPNGCIFWRKDRGERYFIVGQNVAMPLAGVTEERLPPEMVVLVDPNRCPKCLRGPHCKGNSGAEYHSASPNLEEFVRALGIQ